MLIQRGSSQNYKIKRTHKLPQFWELIISASLCPCPHFCSNTPMFLIDLNPVFKLMAKGAAGTTDPGQLIWGLIKEKGCSVLRAAVKALGGRALLQGNRDNPAMSLDRSPTSQRVWGFTRCHGARGTGWHMSPSRDPYNKSTWAQSSAQISTVTAQGWGQRSCGSALFHFSLSIREVESLSAFVFSHL